MSKKFIEDVEQALGPVLAKHFYAKSSDCPTNLRLFTQHAARLASVRFIRSQTNSVVEAAKLLGTDHKSITKDALAMGYSSFSAIPRDEWGIDKLFYKKT